MERKLLEGVLPITRGAKVSCSKREQARAFRRTPTPSEERAWELLRNRRCLGPKFRRQHPIRGYIVDFYCAELRLVLEVDGSWHDKRADYDATRSRDLAKAGVQRVLRITPQQVTEPALRALLLPLSR
jgi:very-short-patch-repair endonuclease